MASFSERMGIKPTKTIVQLNGMDDDLRNGLWNVLDRKLFSMRNFNEASFTEALWWHFFKKPVDKRPIYHSGFGDPSYGEVWEEIRAFFFKCEWYEVYDFIEFVLKMFPREGDLRRFIELALVTDNSGFRIIDDRLVPISDELEVQEVSSAVDGRFTIISEHIRASISHLTDRSNPDYRNSIKEAISAVEAIAKIVSGEPKATLGDALRILEKSGKLHPALKGAFSKMYGYTNDAEGIRHALLNESNLTQADARYFLVVCSAFVNLLKAQAT